MLVPWRFTHLFKMRQPNSVHVLLYVQIGTTKTTIYKIPDLVISRPVLFPLKDGESREVWWVSA